MDALSSTILTSESFPWGGRETGLICLSGQAAVGLGGEEIKLGRRRGKWRTRPLKRRFSNLIVVESAYSYLQDLLPHVAQAAVSEGWVDLVGMGRMVLTYPEMLWDSSEGRPIQRKRICRTFSDCITAPRNGLPSGCYRLDSYY